MDQHLSPSVTEKLEAGAFRSLCDHLKGRSDEVQNIDLMTVSGFCRNCLAKVRTKGNQRLNGLLSPTRDEKYLAHIRYYNRILYLQWMVVEARRLSAKMKEDLTDKADLSHINALDAMGYDEAAQYVYGCNHTDWKKTHTKKASEKQMELFDASKPIQAIHNEEMLAPKSEKPALHSKEEVVCVKPSLLSNVCCQDVEEVVPPLEQGLTRTARTIPPFTPPTPPKGAIHFTCAILTISDRAFNNEYETGDLSGPAVEDAIMMAIAKDEVSCSVVDKTIVLDNIDAIQAKLKDYASQGVHLVLTTGGTGFASRDVTPEATAGILDRPLPGLLAFVTTECSQTQPLSSLSRGAAGLRDKTFIVNLPGNPKGVHEIVPLLLPIIIHGIKDIQDELN